MYLYLASPYSHDDSEVVELRYRCTEHAVAVLLQQGVAVYSPIVHCHYLARIHGMPTDAKFWERYNQRMLAPAKKLLVLQLEDWEKSIGVRGEINYAVTHCKPILYRRFKEICGLDYSVDDYML